MTSEQVQELGSALEILSAKSAVVKERTELRRLIAENDKAEHEEGGKPNPLNKRLKSILTKIDKQLEEYDTSVGSRLNMFSANSEGMIAAKDLRSALEVINHRPSEDEIKVLLTKLDPDGDGFIPLDDILQLAEGEGLGILIEEAAVALKEDAQAIRADVSSPPPSSSSSSSATAQGAKSDGEVKKDEEKVEKKLKREDVVRE